MATKNKIKECVKSTLKFVGYKIVLPMFYQWYARKPIDKKLVVFADHRDRKMPDNFKGLYKMCMENGFQCEFLSGSSFGAAVPRQRRKWEHMRYRFKFMKLFARCKVMFLVEHLDLADIVKKRPETQLVQLWHACGLMKKWGYAVTSQGWGNSAKEKKRYPLYVNQTLSTISSSSPIVRNGYVAAFQCDPSIIKPLGSPRTDIYFDETFRMSAREKVRKMFPEIKKRKIILYAPTFRGKSIPRSYIDRALDYKKLKNSLGEQYVLLTKFHPQMAKKGFLESDRIQGAGFAFDISELLSPEEALCTADILITDYSSIMFEYLFLERPIISYVYDLDKYIQDRGLFLPYDQLAPGPYVFNQEELIEKLQTVDKWFDIERIRAYRKEFMSACDGHSTERIYQYVFGNAQEHEKNA